MATPEGFLESIFIQVPQPVGGAKPTVTWQPIPRGNSGPFSRLSRTASCRPRPKATAGVIAKAVCEPVCPVTAKAGARASSCVPNGQLAERKAMSGERRASVDWRTAGSGLESVDALRDPFDSLRSLRETPRAICVICGQSSPGLAFLATLAVYLSCLFVSWCLCGDICVRASGAG